jgi:gas vesicle protein
LRVAYISDTETIPEDGPGDASVSRWRDDTETQVSGNPPCNTMYACGTNGLLSLLQNTGFASPLASRVVAAETPSPSATAQSNGVHAPLPYPAAPIHVTNVQNQTTSGPSTGAETSSSAAPAAIASSIPAPGMLSTPSKSSNSVPRAEINSLSQSIPNHASGNQTTSSSVAQTVEEQLAAARDQIAQLQNRVAKSDLAQSVQGAVGNVQAKAAQVIPQAENIEGYQLTVVLAVAVAAFSIGYLWHSWA